MDITVEDITSDSLASKTTGESSAIYNDTYHVPDAFNSFLLPVGASRIESGTQVDVLVSASSNISIDTASTAPSADDWALDSSHVSASTLLAAFVESMPASVEGRLIPPPILLWLRSRLDTKGEYSVSTVLTVAWWQPLLIRILPLKSRSTVVSYRLRLKPSTSYSKSASWWWGISTKNPSADQINRVCGDHRLVYLRTTDVLNIDELRSSLRKHSSYRSYRIRAIFPFAIDLWEILVERDYVNQFTECAKACDYVVEKNVHPGNPVGRPSEFRNRFESCLRARERLIGRASITRLASGNNKFASCAATIYRDLVKLYRCYDAYKTLVSMLLATDQPTYTPGWSCVTGLSRYPTVMQGEKSIAS